MEWLVAVDVDIPAEAAAIHGITTEHSREYGRRIEEVISEIASALAISWRPDAVIDGSWPIRNGA